MGKGVRRPFLDPELDLHQRMVGGGRHGQRHPAGKDLMQCEIRRCKVVSLHSSEFECFALNLIRQNGSGKRSVIGGLPRNIPGRVGNEWPGPEEFLDGRSRTEMESTV